MAQLGRISGQLLKANLVRDNVPLSFRNEASDPDLLYLDVSNARIGVNNSSPTTDLDVTGTTRTTTAVVDNILTVGDLHFTGNTISADTPEIRFAPSGSDPVVYNSRLQIDDLEITGNVISTHVSNSNLEIRPSGTGALEVFSDTNINGNLYVTGNINADGNLTLGGNIIIGDDSTDTIDLQASIVSNLLPEEDNTYSIGTAELRWSTIHVNNLYADTLNLPTLNIGDISVSDNTITAGAGLDLVIDGSGAGGVQLANFKFVDNTITNVVNNAITIIQQTGTGYFKIDTSNGFVPPRGPDADRPTAYAVPGMTRYNTTSKAIEVWDGASWASPAGASGAVSEITANDIAASFALTLG